MNVKVFPVSIFSQLLSVLVQRVYSCVFRLLLIQRDRFYKHIHLLKQ